MAYTATHINDIAQLKLVAEAIKAHVAEKIAEVPEEMFLDQAKTTFVNRFTWDSATYPGSTNPNLDTKPVMVLAVKGETNNVTYSFVNLEDLMNVYTVKAGDSSKILNIDGYEIEVKISAETDNAIEVKSNGLYVRDKIAAGTADNLPAFDSSGNLADSGIAKNTVVLTSQLATNQEVTDMLEEVFPTSASNGE